MRFDNNHDYISLQEATKLCNYSQEYLSLRARQGKLKALKFYRNWVTKKEWLKEYLAGVEEYNHQISSKKAKKKIVKAKIIKHPPPQNLPVETFFQAKGLRWRDLRPAFTAVLVFVLIMAGGIFEKESLIKSYNEISPYIEEITEARDLFIEDTAQSLIKVYQDLGSFSDDFYMAAINYQDTVKFTSNVFEEYGQWIKNQILEIRIENIIKY